MKCGSIESESEVIVLLLLLSRSTTSYTSGWLGIVEQVQNIVHKVVLMWILLVVKASFQGLLEDCYNVGAVGG